jgi:hypothetical protein
MEPDPLPATVEIGTSPLAAVPEMVAELPAEPVEAPTIVKPFFTNVSDFPVRSGTMRARPTGSPLLRSPVVSGDIPARSLPHSQQTLSRAMRRSSAQATPLGFSHMRFNISTQTEEDGPPPPLQTLGMDAALTTVTSPSRVLALSLSSPLRARDGSDDPILGPIAQYNAMRSPRTPTSPGAGSPSARRVPEADSKALVLSPTPRTDYQYGPSLARR